MLVPAEIVNINFSTYEVEILNSDHSIKRKEKVSKPTIWRLVQLWVKTPDEWRSLEWETDHEYVARFRHRREIDFLGVMTWEQYHQYRLEGNGYE